MLTVDFSVKKKKHLPRHQCIPKNENKCVGINWVPFFSVLSFMLWFVLRIEALSHQLKLCEFQIQWQQCYWNVNFCDRCIVWGNVKCVHLCFRKRTFFKGFPELNSECRSCFANECIWIWHTAFCLHNRHISYEDENYWALWKKSASHICLESYDKWILYCGGYFCTNFSQIYLPWYRLGFNSSY